MSDNKENSAKTYSWDDLKTDEAKSKKGLLILIHGKVYNIAKFLDEHPGGDEVLMGEAGRDATDAFEDVGHSEEARALLKKYYVGEGPNAGEQKKSSVSGPQVQRVQGPGTVNGQPASYAYLYPLAAVVAYFAYRIYTTNFA
ncbi:hypothetical protein ACM66B_006177 [Microbotryomycetes sp. NB124-2]